MYTIYSEDNNIIFPRMWIVIMQIRVASMNGLKSSVYYCCNWLNAFVHCLSCSILLATPFWPTLGSCKASTSFFHVGTPVLITWSTICSHPASMSWRKLGESVMDLSRLSNQGPEPGPGWTRMFCPASIGSWWCLQGFLYLHVYTKGSLKVWSLAIKLAQEMLLSSELAYQVY